MRRESDSMRLRAFKQYLATLPPERPLVEADYRGFSITGRGSRWFVSGDPRVFKSRVAAERAVDACLALRAELADYSL